MTRIDTDSLENIALGSSNLDNVLINNRSLPNPELNKELLANPALTLNQFDNPELTLDQYANPELLETLLDRSDIIPVELDAVVREYTGVLSVNGKTGIVILTGEDINTSTAEDSNTIQEDIELLYDSKEDVTNKVTSISSTSTDTEYPSAKAVFDYVSPASHDHDNRYYRKDQTYNREEINAAIEQEKLRAQAEESRLSGEISTETSARTLADTVLLTNIDTEETSRISADTALQGNIDTESQVREAADIILQGNIDAEATTRSAKDTELLTNIDTEEVARISADAVLQGNINTESLTREAADVTLLGNIDIEATTRSNKDTELLTNISNESQRAVTAESSLSDDIAAEAQLRETADTNITSALTAHTSRTDNPHSVTKTQVGLGNVDNKSEATIKSDFTGTLASGNTGFAVAGDVYTELAKKQDNLPTKVNEKYLYTNSSGQLEWAEAGKVDDVKVDGSSVVSDKIAYIDLTGKQDVIQDLSAIRSNAAAGKSASDTISTYGDIVTHDVDEFATAAQGAKADTAVLPAAIADMATKTWVTSKDYATTTYVDNHHDSTKLDANQKGVANGVAELDSNGYVIGVETVDNVTSAGSTKPLAANQGKILADRIENLESRGRYLSIWNCDTGYPTTEPTTSPYTYRAGDYFIVGSVSTSGTNYKPDGQTFVIGTHSTKVETEDVSPNDYYIYDSTTWKLLKNTQKEIAFSNIGGDPYDNNALAGALNEKSDVDHTHDGRYYLKSEVNTLLAGKSDVGHTHDDRYYTESEVDAKLSEKSKVSVSNTGTSTSKVKYITVDGTEYKMADEPTELTVKLEEDLYTYVNIGKITGASLTNPIKVADAGDPLKDVFNAILGTEVDVNPTINLAGTTFTKSAQTGTTSANGAEVGTSISAQTGVVTYTVTTTATCSYGLKAGSYDTYNKKSATTFNYPIKTRTVTIGDTTYNYQIKIAYPVLNGCTISVTTGTLVKDDTSNKILYCNVDSSNKVAVSISIPAGTSTTAALTRFGLLSADVSFDPATYNGVIVDNFWTYLKAVYTNSKTHSDITGVKSTAYTITAGTYYPYYAQSDAASMPATIPQNTGTKSTDAVCYTNGADHNINKKYFYFFVPSAKSNHQILQYITGLFNNMDTTNDGTKTLTLNTGAAASYKIYRTDELAPSTLKLRIST